jgi:hypothetical protein
MDLLAVPVFEAGELLKHPFAAFFTNLNNRWGQYACRHRNNAESSSCVAQRPCSVFHPLNLISLICYQSSSSRAAWIADIGQDGQLTEVGEKLEDGAKCRVSHTEVGPVAREAAVAAPARYFRDRVPVAMRP